MSVLAGVLVFACLASSRASDVELPALAGHPRGRFPLALYAAPTADAKLAAVLRRAVDDWNLLFRGAFGVKAFRWTAKEDEAAIRLDVRPSSRARLLGETELEVDDDGTIRIPVRITLSPPKPRGQTPADVVFYQVAAHELGHALGLPHDADPRSIMCCVRGGVDFTDPATRRAYVEARRHPDLHSLKAELVRHYEAFWRGRVEATPAGGDGRAPGPALPMEMPRPRCAVTAQSRGMEYRVTRGPIAERTPRISRNATGGT